MKTVNMHQSLIRTRLNYKITKPKPDSRINPYTDNVYSSNYYILRKVRKTLPIWRHKKYFLELLRKNKIILINGETGSGKTTQVPQWCAEYLHKNNMEGGVCCTQPRRVAAMSMAQRVADEMDVYLGVEVGYNIRFDNYTSSDTFLTFVTDGVLMRQAMSDPLLKHYSCIILDEAHIRTISTDILMGHLKTIINNRKNLTLIVMSATFNTFKFRRYFKNAPIFNIDGRMFPVDIVYCPKPQRDYLHSALDRVCDIHKNEESGDILLFLTGQNEIEIFCSEINEKIISEDCLSNITVIPFYANLSKEEQQLAFEKCDPNTYNGSINRKLIVSTNIAETSVTIDGIVYVIDCGFYKEGVYNPRLRVNVLLISAISKANAMQRAGRAGRTKPGKCYRLYTQKCYNELIPDSSPEIIRCNFNSIILLLKKIKIHDIVHFDFLDPPAPETMMSSLEDLYNLSALDENTNLTALGELMTQFPVSPQLSKAIIASCDYGCAHEVVIIVAMLSAPSCFHVPYDKKMESHLSKSNFDDVDGDHFSLLNVYRKYKNNKESQYWCHQQYLNHESLQIADLLIERILLIMKSLNLKVNDDHFTNRNCYENIKKSLISGFFMQIAQRRNGEYKVPNGPYFTIHPSSSLVECLPSWVLYHELLFTNDKYLNICTSIDHRWIYDFPELFKISKHKLL
ncbi:putative ATP-dependent RNA helicase [Intoshia linei]|uniref:RNA helicase n=1 Tax=Intoshia linei TaxID=1819745 RepID=A0A177ASB6_9BILA|nr:putative ATP-dependent RNA helicase [Intoshia linei]